MKIKLLFSALALSALMMDAQAHVTIRKRSSENLNRFSDDLCFGGLDYALSSSFSTALGGTGANQPTRSSSTPTMMKEAIRAMPPLLESSMRKSLTTTIAISAAPVIQKGRSLRRLPYTMRMMAVTAHTTERLACRPKDWSMMSSRQVIPS
nr:MAG TPA: hypothetical protein [Caudoviricetes sp.]